MIPAAAVAVMALSRPIENLRPRLDPTLTRSWPSDPDLTAVIRAYRFGLVLLLKSPPGSEYSTRSPPPLKNNYSLAQDFAQTPLSFLNFKPAVQRYQDYEDF